MNRIVAGYQFGGAGVGRQSSVSKLSFIKAKLLFRFLFLGVFILVLSLFYIWSRIQIVQMGYELNERVLEQKELFDTNKKLRMELSVMKSPKRLEAYATDKLQMKFADKDHIVQLVP